MNKDINIENPEKIHHKILFFFMPESIVFFKKNSKDTIQTEQLKDIFPNFYWCSAHEFSDPSFEKKYLIQHQVYSVENNDIKAENLEQFWISSKNEIRLNLMSFLDKWRDHKRMLLSSNISEFDSTNGEIENLRIKNNDSRKENFLEFANFVAKSIFNFKPIYLEQVRSGGFDVTQKEFWKNAAFQYMDALRDYLKAENNIKKISKKTSKKRIKKTLNNKTKNETK